jgi:hypothetical protein
LNHSSAASGVANTLRWSRSPTPYLYRHKPRRSSSDSLLMRSGHFAFSFTLKRERRSAIPIACARAFTATTVRPSSSEMSKSEALEMTNSRSRSSSSEVQALQLFILLVVISSGHARFRALDATGLSFFASLFSDYGLAGTISCRPRGNGMDRRTVVSNSLLYARRCAGSWLSYVILRSRVAS